MAIAFDRNFKSPGMIYPNDASYYASGDLVDQKGLGYQDFTGAFSGIPGLINAWELGPSEVGGRRFQFSRRDGGNRYKGFARLRPDGSLSPVDWRLDNPTSFGDLTTQFAPVVLAGLGGLGAAGFIGGAGAGAAGLGAVDPVAAAAAGGFGDGLGVAVGGGLMSSSLGAVGATNPALIESALGSAGYGMSSAGAGGASGLGLGTDLLTRFQAALGNLGSSGGGVAGKAASSPFDSLMSILGGNGGVKDYLSVLPGAMNILGGLYARNRLGDVADMMKMPSDITKTPGYQAGLEAVERRMAAQGFNGSGNMMAALAKYGGDFYAQEAQRRMMMAQMMLPVIQNQASALGLLGSGLNFFSPR